MLISILPVYLAYRLAREKGEPAAGGGIEAAAEGIALSHKLMRFAGAARKSS